MKKMLLFAAAIAAGLLFPQGAEISWLLKPLLMGLLFYAFLDIHLDRSLFHWQIPIVFVANACLAVVLYMLISPLDPTFALALFSVAFAPTATAAPAIMFFLRGNVEFVIASVLFSNISAALLLPFIYTWLLNPGSTIATGDILQDTLLVILIPFILVQALKYLAPRAYRFFDTHKELALYLIGAVIFVAVSKAGSFIRNESSVSLWFLAATAAAAAGLCLILFKLGRRYGSKEFRREIAQSLAHKNTMFMAWFATTYLSPAAALGPIFYLIADTLYNSWQISKVDDSAGKRGRRRSR